MNTRRTLLLGAALLAAPAALAQQHGEHADAPPAGAMDHSQMGEMDHDAMMALHQRMMADSEIHARMMADPEMRALMADVMPPMDHSGMDHGAMNHEGPMDAEARVAMMARMRERMADMTEAEHTDFMARVQAVHTRLMAEPAVHQRMMADPEMRRMMEAVPEGRMDHGSMDDMDHGQMQGMDHSGMDHAAGVAMQRRNAGAHNGDERPATPAVGQAEFDASATADRFHAALASGDRVTVEALLTPDAVILEGGQAEARAEYLGGHFARDAAFLADAQPEPLFRRTTVAGDAAWVASTQRVRDTEMAELLVMKRTADGWRVAAVHWSSAH
jgi:hypothetical protein